MVSHLDLASDQVGPRQVSLQKNGSQSQVIDVADEGFVFPSSTSLLGEKATLQSLLEVKSPTHVQWLTFGGFEQVDPRNSGIFFNIERSKFLIFAEVCV